MSEDVQTKEYELSFWLKDEGGLSKIKSLMSQFSLAPTLVSETRKMPISYPIKKETSGFFGYIHFLGTPESVRSFTHDLQVENDCLRFFISSHLVKPSEEREARRPIVERKAPQREEPKPADTITNEELERKLEEILK